MKYTNSLGKKYSVAFETITPQIAQKLLGNPYKDQRPKKGTWSDKMSSDMTKNRWGINNDAFVLLTDDIENGIFEGYLVNGQNRCQSIVDSNTSQVCLFLRTNDENIYLLLDGGLRRTVADLIHEEYAKAISAIAAKVLAYDNGILLGHHGCDGVSRGDMVDFILGNIETLREVVRIVSSEYSNQKIILPSIAGAFLMIAWRNSMDKDVSIEFIKALYTGLPPGSSMSLDPTLHLLREKLIRNSSARQVTGKLSPNAQFELLVKTYNAIRANEELKKLIVKGEVPRFYFDENK